MGKTNISYAYCNSPADIIYWLRGYGRTGLGLHGYNYMSYPWESLEDGSQIISVSYDQSQDMYLVVFRVKEE